MADDNNKNEASASNLSAEDEAFEQVTATNDENDFVLLSDILPAEDTQHSADFPDTIEEIPLGAEEVTSTESFLPATINGNANSIYESLGDSLTPEYTSTNQASTSHLQDTSKTSINEPVKKRRGRKPKNWKNNQDATPKNIDKIPSNSVKKLSEEPNSSSTPVVPTRARRGRKPINYKELDAGQDLDITSTSASGLVEDGNSLSHTTITDTENDLNKLPKKRGRKKKTINDSEQPQNDSLNNVEDLHEKSNNDIHMSETSNTTVLDTDPEKSKSPKKRGRKKKKIDDSNLNDVQLSKNHDLDMDDDEGDMVLSKLKTTLQEDDNKELSNDHQVEDTFNSLNESVVDDRPTKKPILSDFEYDVNSVIAETPNVVVETFGDLDPNIVPATIINKVTNNTEIITEDQTSAAEQKKDNTVDDTLLVESSSKRPQRRKAKRMKYEIDSDEDPFANVELSDEDTGRNRKKRPYGYYSDDEYVPSKHEKKGTQESSDDDLNSWEDIESEFEDKRRRRGRKKSEFGSLNKSPGKRGKKKIGDDQGSCISDATTVKLDNISDNALDDSMDAKDKPRANFASGNKEFENFLARRMQENTSLKIKKVDKKTTSDNVVVPLEIPVMEAKDMKPVDTSTQTNIVATTSTSVQTTSAYAIKLAKNIDLSSEQSQNACEFLQSILKTTTELGTLMTEKSSEFIDKKINATYVKDTTRIDYCVKKAFLLFKLAKDNLTTMEDNLEKQYEEFLKSNQLSDAIEVEKKIIPKAKEQNSDSDCEIVDVVPVQDKGKRKPEKPKFNPKTVFLNKELSIKIAKKTPEKNIFNSSKKNIDITGKNSVWLNESVMVKKVKSQSFLAQDSRNKKPPDFGITEEMVKLFFDNYYPTEASVLCAPYTSTEWLHINRPVDVICNYFILNKDEQSASTMDETVTNAANTDTDDREAREKLPIVAPDPTNMSHSSPKSLFSLCSQVLLKHVQGSSSHNVDTLSNLCVKKVCSNLNTTGPTTTNVFIEKTIPDTDVEPLECVEQHLDIVYDVVSYVSPLKQLSCEKVIELCNIHEESTSKKREKTEESCDTNIELEELAPRNTYFNSIYMKTLSKLCVESVQKEIFVKKSSKDINGVCVKDVWYSPDTLQKIAFDFLKLLLYKDSQLDPETCHDMNENILYSNEIVSCKANVVKSLFKLSFQKIANLFNAHDNTGELTGDGTFNEMTIGNINTIAEETFFNMDETSNDVYHETNLSEEDETYNEYEDEINEADHEDDQKVNWVAQLKLKELNGYVSNITNPLENGDEQTNPVEDFSAVRIKQEIPEEIPDYSHLNIKKEPDFHPTEMVHIPNNVRTEIENMATKRELIDNLENVRHCSPIQVERVGNYDCDSFETFVRTNKMMMNVSDNEDDSIFSQSGLRVRRQHQPDSDNENEHDMGLLVPTISEPLSISTVKGSLLQESSDDDATKEKTDKKQDKRKKGKSKGKKQVPAKNIAEKDKPGKVQPIVEQPENKEKAKQTVDEPDLTDVSILTRRMREKIRNKEKKIESSDSETEDSMSLLDRRRKVTKKVTDKKEINKLSKVDNTSMSSTVDDEIQCNNVDSTEQIGENYDTSKVDANEKEVDSFSGFSAADQNEITEYQKYLSDVYDKILPGNEESSSSKPSQDDDTMPRDESPDRSNSPFMNNDEPVELLECAPTMPIFEETAKRKPKPKSKKLTEEKVVVYNETPTEVTEKKADSDATVQVNEEVAYTERNGWKCYPLNGTDAKLYQVPYVGLEKLPEEFVETYFRYQEISKISEEDAEIDRLSNLQNINRSGLNEGKRLGKERHREKGDRRSSDADVTGLASPDVSGGEFAPSDDEDVNVEDELPPPAPKQSTDNSLAKNLLMGDDNDSDTEASNIKKEPNTDLLKERKTKEKKVTVFKNPKDLVLTADKMMKKELETLHAPVVLDGEAPEMEAKEKKYSPPKEAKHKEKHSTRVHTRRSKSDDSSSEEEKHWMSTKEKLLKRMEKRTIDGPGPDDAKRAKLVSEYMRRVESVAPGRKAGGRRARNNRKFLEKQKQMRSVATCRYLSVHATRGERGAGAQGGRPPRPE
ncbi:unnamed protein product [Plutella xylostella]|uniref:(diamondback moth) hypothetical protein n=1 Tax=Plutella xylostella TaxID=51655 RepID=A0A8S4GG10_PLUXY|nr:unnamed protein product [Plutella xylostella]